MALNRVMHMRNHLAARQPRDNADLKLRIVFRDELRGIAGDRFMAGPNKDREEAALMHEAPDFHLRILQ